MGVGTVCLSRLHLHVGWKDRKKINRKKVEIDLDLASCKLLVRSSLSNYRDKFLIFST
jgi:hypothetical protein